MIRNWSNDCIFSNKIQKYFSVFCGSKELKNCILGYLTFLTTGAENYAIRL